MTREEFGLVPKYNIGNVLVNDKGERIKILAIVADQYMFDCGDDFPHYDFLDCIESQFTPIKKGEQTMGNNEIEITFGAKDSELIECTYHIPEGMEAIIEGDKVIIRKKESEDERIRKWIISDLKETLSGEDLEINMPEYAVKLREAIAWLEKQSKENMIEALRLEYEKGKADVLQEQRKEWNEEDDRIKGAIIDHLKDSNLTEWASWLERQESVGEIVERCKNSWYNEGKIAGQFEGLSDEEKYQQGWHDALEKQKNGSYLQEKIENFTNAHKGEDPEGIIAACRGGEKQGEKTVIGNGSNSASVSDGDTSVTSKEVVSQPTMLSKDEQYTLARIIESLEDDGCPTEWLTLLNDIYSMTCQKSTEWSKEDTDFKTKSVRYLCNLRDTFEENKWDTKPIQRCINWLLEFPKPLKPQPKQEWSEEDEKMLNDAIGAVYAADWYTYDDKQEIENWLKSLKQKIKGK